MMTRVTTTSLSSLGAALGCAFVLSGCNLLKTGETEANDPYLLPSPVVVQPVEITRETPLVEEPYMLPPLVEGYQEGEPILPEPLAQSEKPKAKPLPDTTDPVIPDLEVKPGHVDSLTLPNSVTKNPEDGLYYKAGAAEPYTGHAVFIHENGQRAFEGFFKKGKRDGKCLGWYANGKLKFEGIFRNDKLSHGHEFWYYIDGLALKLVGVYENGQMIRGLHWDRLGRAYR